MTYKAAQVRAHLAAVQWAQGDRDEALVAMRDSIIAYRDVLGTNTPAVARVWGLLLLMARAQGDPMVADQAQTTLHRLEQVNPGNETVTGVRALLEVTADPRARPARIVAAADIAHAHGFVVLARLTKDITGS